MSHGGFPLRRPDPLRRTRLGVLVALLTVGIVAAGLPAATAAPTDEQLRERRQRLDAEQDSLAEDLERVESRRSQLSSTLAAATERVGALTGELHLLRDETREIAGEITALEGEQAASQEQLAQRIGALYRGAAPNELIGVLGGRSLTDAARRSHFLMALARRDRSQLESAAAVGRQLVSRRGDLAHAVARREAVTAEAELARADLDRQLAEASAAGEGLASELAQREEQSREIAGELHTRAQARAAAERAAAEQAAAERAAAEQPAKTAAAARAPAGRASPQRPDQTVSRAAPRAPSARQPGSPGGSAPRGAGGLACPQDHPRSFTDTWGAPRSGGRSHRGTDIFGAMGGSVFAITSGTIEWTRSGASAGLWLSLRGDDGDRFWYLHLSAFVASAGERVTAGQVIARNGNSGNARGASPHIHFEHHPGGGRPVNPYPLLRGACG